MSKKVVIFAAPSGSGKSTIVGHCLKVFPQFEFSISAASRSPRGQEKDGVDYYFISAEEFRRRIDADAFVEWEEVYPGSYYGTLKSEVDRIWDEGKVIIFDVDVKGAWNLKRYFGDKAIFVFVQAPSDEVLRQRLTDRGTDTPEAIEMRLAKASEEIAYAQGKYDYKLINDDLETAFADVEKTILGFLER